MHDFIVHLDCKCSMAEHHLRMSAMDGEELYIDFHLNEVCTFWKRIWRGLRYAWHADLPLGYHYAEMVISRDEAIKFRDTIDRFLTLPIPDHAHQIQESPKPNNRIRQFAKWVRSHWSI